MLRCFTACCSSLDAIAPRTQKAREGTIFLVDRSAPRTEALLRTSRDSPPHKSKAFQIFLLPPERLPRPSRGPPVRAPPPPPPNPPFSLPIHAQASAGTKMEDGLGGGLVWGLRAFQPSPRPPLSPTPTWAYPCCLLLLPIVTTSAPPRHLNPQTCRGRGGGRGAAAAGSRPRAPPPPLSPRSSPPPPHRPPFSTPRRTGAGRGCRKNLRGCEKQVSARSSRLAVIRPAPRKADRF